MQPLMTTSQWLMLTQHVRNKLVEIFKIPKSSGSQVRDTVVVSDGYTHNDLQVINVLSMQSYLSSEESDFFILLNAVLETIPPPATPTPSAEAPKPIDIKITVDADGKPKAEVVDSSPIIKESSIQNESKTEEGEEGTENKGTASKRGGSKKGNGTKA